MHEAAFGRPHCVGSALARVVLGVTTFQVDRLAAIHEEDLPCDERVIQQVMQSLYKMVVTVRHLSLRNTCLYLNPCSSGHGFAKKLRLQLYRRHRNDLQLQMFRVNIQTADTPMVWTEILITTQRIYPDGVS